MASPSTPTSESPKSRKAWRFVTTGAPCEWAENYRPGGFHPVNLGDTFCDGKYKVIRKLGYGSSSTVWLAVSTGVPKYVALKVMTAKASTDVTELAILNHLSDSSLGDPSAQRLTALLDNFRHQGPNGEHQCLVYELMGTTASTLVEELPENQPKTYMKTQRYPKWMAKRILTQTLQGLVFLHQNGVVHGDVQPGNILFSTKNIDLVPEDDLKQDEASTKFPLKRIDGLTDKWAPTNIYLQQSLHDRVQLGPELDVKLSDLGSAFLLSEPPSKAATPCALRAPELIFQQPFDYGIDVWSFGCLVFEFITGRTLFAIWRFGNDQEARDDADDEHLCQLHDIIQSLPDSMMAKWERSSKWFGPNGEALQPYGDGEPCIHDSLEILFQKNKPADIDDNESAILCALIRQILIYDPIKRPSAMELLEHPWFSEN